VVRGTAWERENGRNPFSNKKIRIKKKVLIFNFKKKKVLKKRFLPFPPFRPLITASRQDIKASVGITLLNLLSLP
jgi:hypothetical protein